MAEAVAPGTVASRSDVRGKTRLLALSVLAALWLCVSVVSLFGAGGRPTFGWWESLGTPRAKYQMVFSDIQPGGASARGGIRSGDHADLREQNLDARTALTLGISANSPIKIRVHRATGTATLRILASTVWERATLLKMLEVVPGNIIAPFWVLCCALLIATRKSGLPEARILALTILCLIPAQSDFRVSNGISSLVEWALQTACSAAALLLLVRLCRSFGPENKWRRAIAWSAYASVATMAAANLYYLFGVATVSADPTLIQPYLGGAELLAAGTTTLVALLAVWNTRRPQRARAAWLLLPVPLALTCTSALESVFGLSPTWIVWVTFYTLAGISSALGAIFVTYAILKRRVLDAEFIVSRAIVVAAVSIVIVIAFVLLEWLLGTVLAGTSHATGVIANAGLAPLLGVSLRFIHKRIDDFVDAVMFRKRHDDERALLDFLNEAAFITNRSALLDQTLSNIQNHTDAGNASIFLEALSRPSAQTTPQYSRSRHGTSRWTRTGTIPPYMVHLYCRWLRAGI